MTDPLELTTLAATAFLAATLLPASSEAVLAGLVVAEAAPIALLLAIASVFNTAGSCVNWLLGRVAERFKDRRWFPVSADSLERAQVWYRRYGVWSLLASWVPIIGDPLTVAAGVMRTPITVFLPLVALAKTARYAVIVWLLS
ncbi:MAG: YqaA family protein [Alphaproteobacteria bacterium]